MEELKRVKAERDEYRRLADQWRDDWTAAMDHRDALAAHVERLLGCLVIDDDGADIKKVSELKEAISQSPATSLTRRDLIKQAEGAEMVSEDAKMRIEKANAIYPKFDNSGYRQCIYTADSVAANLRQQAESHQ